MHAGHNHQIDMGWSIQLQVSSRICFATTMPLMPTKDLLTGGSGSTLEPLSLAAARSRATSTILTERSTPCTDTACCWAMRKQPPPMPQPTSSTCWPGFRFNLSMNSCRQTTQQHESSVQRSCTWKLVHSSRACPACQLVLGTRLRQHHPGASVPLYFCQPGPTGSTALSWPF